MWKVREIADKVTNVVMNYTDIEAKVREATNDDAWGPTGTIRHELAQATFSYDQFPEVMGMLWKRIAENKRSPRRIYKSLLLVHHLLLNGSDRVIRATTDRLYEIRQLQDYHVVYEPGFNLSAIIPVDEYKDGEVNVRVKAKEIVELVQDEERLREDRKKAKKNRDKYVGIGSDRSMSKWNDFDDDLQFPRQSTSSKFDDFDGDDDNSSSVGIGSKSKSSSSNNKESPKSINLKLRGNNEDDDDFNPRATEEVSHSNSFPSRAKKDTGKGVNSSTNNSGDCGDFADFQSAFGGTGASSNSMNHGSSLSTSSTSQNNNSSSKAIHESHLHHHQDLFTPGPPSPQQQSASSNLNSSVDLLGLDMSPSILSSSSVAQTQHVIGSSSANTLSSSFDAFQGFQLPTTGGSQGSSLFNLSGPVAPSGLLTFQSVAAPMMPPFQQQHSSPLPPQQQQHILFGSPSPAGDHFGELLQPQQVNNINNNHVQAGAAISKGSVNKKALEGTTWSDLNFSMDDLSLSSKPKQAAQPTMNQLLSSPTTLSKPF